MYYRIAWPADGKYAECWPYNPIYTLDGVERCPRCHSNLQGKYWVHPRVLHISNLRYADFLFTTPYPAVSERFKELYEASNLRGILLFDPIEEYHVRKNAKPAPRYYTIQTIRSNILVDCEHSNIVWMEPHEHSCPLCDPLGRRISEARTIVLTEENNTGEDIFRLYQTGKALYVSERFVDFAKKNAISNIGLIPLNDMKNKIILWSFICWQ